MERLGGLLRLAPWTGLTFLVGAAAISGLPPLNGFVSEFLVLVGALKGVATQPAGGAVPLLIVVAALALIGGLAAACFAKAFGIVFLGAPRAPLPSPVSDPGLMMKLPLVLLAAACLTIGLISPWLVPQLGAGVEVLHGGSGAAVREILDGAGSWLAGLVACAAGVAAVTALLLLLRRRLLANRDVRVTVTWDCGYTAPTPRMQYTASSFVHPLTSLFQPVLGTHTHWVPPLGPFPPEASFSTKTPDTAKTSRPTFVRPRRGRAPGGLSPARVPSGPLPFRPDPGSARHGIELRGYGGKPRGRLLGSGRAGPVASVSRLRQAWRSMGVAAVFLPHQVR